MILVGLLAAAAASAAPAIPFGPATLTASLVYDVIGRRSVPNYASVEMKDAAKVTCLKAEASPIANSYATCYVFAPGFHGNVAAGDSVVTSGPGVVRLGCDGYPYPIRCSARVGD